jgi:hypothetical protein
MPMPDITLPDPAFAIRDDEQYQPTEVLGDQHVRVPGPAGGGLLLCHASRGVDMPHSSVERLIIVVHGALRDSGRYLRHAQAAAGQAGARTLIVAPQFLAAADVAARAGIPAAALYWDVEGWKGGQPALGPAPLSSFTAMDSLLQQLTEPGRLSPGGNLAVVIIGNSAGGQYVNRYAAVGRAPDALAKLGISVRFIIANPSTYLYFDWERPVTVPDRSRVNRWRYGFEAAPSYVDGDPRQSLERYLARDVTIVLGAEDRDGAALLLEVSPAAMAQGANRRERGIYYDEHVRRLARAAGLTAAHRLIQLAGVGHPARDVLAAPQARELMFG